MNENTCSDIPSFRTQIKRWFRSDCCAASIGGLKQWQSELNNIYGHSIPDCNELSCNNDKDIDILFINASGNSIRKDHQQIKNAAAAEQVLKDDGLLVCIIDSEEVFEAWQNIYERFGFSLINHFLVQPNNPDFSNLFLVFIRTEKREAAQRSVKAIIEDDQKKTTYKLALLRAVCDLSVSMPTAVSFPSHMENLRIERELLENRKRDALSEEKRGRRPKNALRSYEITIPENIPNRISVPFGLVLERILEYYWHIFAESKDNVYPAQSNSKSPLKFRKALSKLVDSYCGDFERFRNEWYSGHFSSADDAFKLEKVRCITNAFKKISETILNGPIKYSGNSQENPSKLKHWLIFSVLQENKQKLYSTPEAMIKSEGSLFMPAGLWFEISNSSTWLKDSIIVEWAQLSEFFSRNSDNEKCKKYTTAEIIPLLLPHDRKSRI